jgi:hypothetical protein
MKIHLVSFSRILMKRMNETWEFPDENSPLCLGDFSNEFP